MLKSLKLFVLALFVASCASFATQGALAKGKGLDNALEKVSKNASQKAVDVISAKVNPVIPSSSGGSSSGGSSSGGSSSGGVAVIDPVVPNLVYNIGSNNSYNAGGDFSNVASPSFSVDDLASLAPAAGGKALATTGESKKKYVDLYEEFGDGMIMVEVDTEEEEAIYDDEGVPKVSAVKVASDIARKAIRLKNGNIDLGS